MKATIYTPSLRHKLAAVLHTLASMPAMLAALALPLVLVTSCATEELVDPNPGGTTPTAGQQITITASLGSDNGKPGTRMDYTPDDAGTGMKTTWATGDAFNIVPVDKDDSEGTDAQTFTLDNASIGKSTGNFTGTAPTNGTSYIIYHPKEITSSVGFENFSYAEQVQKGNDNRNHLTAKHSIKKKVTNYMDIDFAADVTQSSCMKFVLTPGQAITPTKITLASADGSECFYTTNKSTVKAYSLSLTLKDFGTIAADGTITAYMMMSHQKVTLPDAGIIVTVYANNGSSYTQTIIPASDTTLESGLMHTITANDMKVELQSMKFTVKVDATSGLGFSIPFPTSETTPADITVDWGDGKGPVIVEKYTNLTKDDAFNHTYDGAGTYTITITSSQTDETQPQIPEINFYNRSSNNNRMKLLSMDSPLLNTKQTNFNDCFYYCKTLVAIHAGLFNKNTVATSFNNCFSTCTSLTAIPAGLFNNNPKATNFDNCFYNCEALKAIPAGLFDSNKEATGFSKCFYGCEVLTAIPAGLFDNNPKAKNFNNCFNYCALTTIPAGLFDSNKEATDFSSCFYRCEALKAIPAGLFDSNKDATNFSSCFYLCRYLTEIPEGLFSNNTKATNFSYCFSNCTKLKLNANIFCIETTETKKTRFAEVASINFSQCFYSAGSSLTADVGAAPALWEYTFKQGVTLTSVDCFSGCNMSNAMPADKKATWGTPKGQ